MAICDMLLPEFDQEMANTRKMLERIPEDRFDYQPHPKSWKLNRLAGHVADLPSWVHPTMTTELLELSPDMYAPFVPSNREELLDHFDKYVKEARAAIAAATDEQMNTIWTMKWDGKTVMTMPRYNVLRSVVLNHGVHHRAQLGMFCAWRMQRFRACTVRQPTRHHSARAKRQRDSGSTARSLPVYAT